MVLLHTPERDATFKAQNFKLKATDGKFYTLDDLQGKNGTLIFFICNHCPYVIAIIDRIVKTCDTLEKLGVGCAAIMSNDTAAYPADSFDKMIEFAQAYNFKFPYLIDETQEVARSYDAVCTPDFFGFDKDNTLFYRGRLDSAANQPATTDTQPELLDAFCALINGDPLPEEQFSSMGCSIKWRA